MKIPSRRAPLVVALLALAACAGPGGGPAKIRHSPTDAKAAPKPANCSLEIFRKAPARPFDELGELDAHVTKVPPGGAVEVLRPQACQLGADALIVTQDMVLNEFEHTKVTATAIRWSAAPAPTETPTPPPEASQPPPAPAPDASQPKQ